MCATLAKYKTSDYSESSGKFLNKAEKLSIEHLGNAWQQFSVEAKQSPIAYYQIFTNTELPQNNISNRRTPFKKSFEMYIPFEDVTVPVDLKPVYEEIERSKEILDLEEGWDGADAPSIPKLVYDKSIAFLKEYSNFIYNNTGVAIDAPEINPGRNENIFLSWRTKKARLAISIEQKDEELIANYYGDLNDKQPIKGNVSTLEISEFLAYWMKNLI